MFKNALRKWQPHADEPAGKEEGKRIMLQCTDSSLLDYDIPPGRWLIAEVVHSINPSRPMVCCMKQNGRAIIGMIEPLNLQRFKVGNTICRYTDVYCFAVILEIKQVTATR